MTENHLMAMISPFIIMSSVATSIWIQTKNNEPKQSHYAAQFDGIESL